MGVNLKDYEESMLNGKYGPGMQMAMTIVVRMAEVLEATELLAVSQAHIDGCGLMSDSGLEFAEKLAALNARVSVPTTLNMIPVDLQNWRKQGVPENYALKATRMANAYIQMGCIPTWTCAPYQSYLAPHYRQQIAWGESNAIVYANSVYGARTNRYADYMDICAAITARVPRYGLHLTENRRGQMLIRLMDLPQALFADNSFYPVLGYFLGKLVQDRIPVIEGLTANLSSDNFKALGAAAASSGAVGLIHIIGLTPEASTLEDAFQGSSPEETIDVHLDDLLEAKAELSHSSRRNGKLDAVVLGCPHFSFMEFQALVKLIHQIGRPLSREVRLIILSNQISVGLLQRADLLDEITNFGAELVVDTCVFHSPIVSSGAQLIMTNSGKCAYYGPGELNTQVLFGDLEDCILSAVNGEITGKEDAWNRY
jgi:predicted aconitase